MRSHYYIMIGESIVATDIKGWMIWHAAHYQELQIAYTVNDSFEISTIFLGLNRNMRALLNDDDEAPPLIFETMAFEVENNQRGNDILTIMDSTKEEALQTHERVIKFLSDKQEQGIKKDE